MRELHPRDRIEELSFLRERIAKLEAANKILADLVGELAHPEDCRFDSDGVCIVHKAEFCPHLRAANWLAAKVGL